MCLLCVVWRVCGVCTLVHVCVYVWWGERVHRGKNKLMKMLEEMFLWAVRTGEEYFSIWDPGPHFHHYRSASSAGCSLTDLQAEQWAQTHRGHDPRRLCCSLSPCAALSERSFATEAQGYTFFRDECRLVPLVPVLQSWGLSPRFSLSVHSFPWPASALHKKHPSTSNFKKPISHAAIPLCGWNGNKTGLSTIWQNRKKNRFWYFSCSP